MPRLPSPPDLDWTPDGAPVARSHDDVYFSAEGGLAESRAVFLAGCGLPEAWTGRTRYTVAELGFGTGLNFLALWALWRDRRPSPEARLHFVSFEGYPLDPDQAARALAAWPELAPLSEKLVAAWPHRTRGVRRIDWPEDGISLTLHVDEILPALENSRFEADAWFLDGFSPAKNEAMWAEAVYPLLAERSVRNARLATFTVAGAVRRSLTAAGFVVDKRPGHGRKRERLEAKLSAEPERPVDPYGLRAPAEPPARIAILGAGIAGAACARALSARGVEAVVFDPSPEPASGASGNPLGLLMPRLDAGDTVQARLLIDAYLHARAAYAGLPGALETEVRQTPKDDAEKERFAKLLTDPPLPLEDLEALAGGGLLHKRALILRPREIVRALLDGAELRLGAAPQIDPDARTVNGEPFDAIIAANGAAAGSLLPAARLVGKLGQVEHMSNAPEAPASALASGHYAIAAGPERLWGATFETHDGPPMISEAARLENRTALEALSPWWLRQALDGEAVSRAGVRATTPDRLPVIGAAPDETEALRRFGGLRTGRRVDADAPLLEGLYVASGFGARGFTWAPWAASILAARLFGEPAPAAAPALEAVSPMRFILRRLKRGAL